MVHIGRPGEDGFTERVLASWGVDGHNSHTNVCSSGGRTGYQFWMGADRPSPDYANAKVIYLISAHLEAGHYFNPHAQRITSARSRGAKVIVLDTRLSNTATHADHWLSPVPGSEAAINLAVAQHLIATGRYDREFVRQWWNWAEYLQACHPHLPVTFEAFENVLASLVHRVHVRVRGRRVGHRRAACWRRSPRSSRARAPASPHTSGASAAAGNLGGWQVARTLFLISALLGAVATEGGMFPNGLNKFVPVPIHTPPHPGVWQDLTWPLEYPLAQNEMSFLLPHFLDRGPRQARHLFHPGLQPGMDQPGRPVLDGGPDRREQDRLLRGAHPDLERVGLLRRLRPSDGTRLRSGMTPIPTSSTTGSGSGSASRCCARPASASGRPSPTPAR